MSLRPKTYAEAIERVRSADARRRKRAKAKPLKRLRSAPKRRALPAGPVVISTETGTVFPLAVVAPVVRSSTTTRAPGAAKGKAARLRSRAWLDVVRASPCEVSGCVVLGDTDPHHVLVRGRRDDTFDFTALPLCREHHDDAHAGRIPLDELHRMLGAFLCRSLPRLSRSAARVVLDEMNAGLGA